MCGGPGYGCGWSLPRSATLCYPDFFDTISVYLPIHVLYPLRSWFLSQALRSLSYTHLSPSSLAQLNLDFATLLESLGMWHWAIFVLQHNPVARARDHAVKELLPRSGFRQHDKMYFLFGKKNFCHFKARRPVTEILIFQVFDLGGGPRDGRIPDQQTRHSYGEQWLPMSLARMLAVQCAIMVQNNQYSGC